MGTQHQTSKMLLRLLVVTLFVSLVTGEEKIVPKDAKAFSLFNVVTFKNSDCESTSTSNTGVRNGTCFTSEECDEKGGMAAGACAMGFGTCCVFTYKTCGTDVKENCSYVQNEGFPTALTGDTASTCNYKIEKCDPKVCTLRLDFESFTILAGTASLDKDSECQDTFNVNGLANGFSQIPTICGSNTGEHMYVEIGPGATDSATLAFSFGAVAGTRSFELKVTQYLCDSPNRPPDGCLQYHTGTTGTLRTFNFANTGDIAHLPNQQYSICLRQEAGFCCAKYSVCTDAESWTLFRDTTPQALVDSDCSEDWVGIEGSSAVCGSPETSNRFCGDVLSPFATADLENVEICQCNSPFIVRIHTDGVQVDDGSGTLVDNDDVSDDVLSRGVCLNYVQVPC